MLSLLFSPIVADAKKIKLLKIPLIFKGLDYLTDGELDLKALLPDGVPGFDVEIMDEVNELTNEFFFVDLDKYLDKFEELDFKFLDKFGKYIEEVNVPDFFNMEDIEIPYMLENFMFGDFSKGVVKNIRGRRLHEHDSDHDKLIRVDLPKLEDFLNHKLIKKVDKKEEAIIKIQEYHTALNEKVNDFFIKLQNEKTEKVVKKVTEFAHKLSGVAESINDYIPEEYRFKKADKLIEQVVKGFYLNKDIVNFIRKTEEKVGDSVNVKYNELIKIFPHQDEFINQLRELQLQRIASNASKIVNGIDSVFKKTNTKLLSAVYLKQA